MTVCPLTRRPVVDDDGFCPDDAGVDGRRAADEIGLGRGSPGRAGRRAIRPMVQHLARFVYGGDVGDPDAEPSDGCRTPSATACTTGIAASTVVSTLTRRLTRSARPTNRAGTRRDIITTNGATRAPPNRASFTYTEDGRGPPPGLSTAMPIVAASAEIAIDGRDRHGIPERRRVQSYRDRSASRGDAGGSLGVEDEASDAGDDGIEDDEDDEGVEASATGDRRRAPATVRV